MADKNSNYSVSNFELSIKKPYSLSDSSPLLFTNVLEPLVMHLILQPVGTLAVGFFLVIG